MDVWIFVIFFFAILIPLILGIVIPIYKNHHKATGDIINYDSSMRKFVYKVYLSREEIIKALKIKNVRDVLTCTLDLDRSVIRLEEYGSRREYYFDVQEEDRFSILKLEQVALIGMQSYVPYKLNCFMINKINAEIIPFSHY